jgi:hypothetical protein
MSAVAKAVTVHYFLLESIDVVPGVIMIIMALAFAETLELADFLP